MKRDSISEETEYVSDGSNPRSVCDPSPRRRQQRQPLRRPKMWISVRSTPEILAGAVKPENRGNRLPFS